MPAFLLRFAPRSDLSSRHREARVIAEVLFAQQAVAGAQTKCTHVNAGHRVGRQQDRQFARVDLLERLAQHQHRLRARQMAGVYSVYGRVFVRSRHDV